MSAKIDAKTVKPIEEIKGFINRFAILPSEAALDAVTLWILHTYAMDAAYTTPYLYVHSAEPQSGKTRVMEVAQKLVRSPQSASNLTVASLFRRMATSSPTLMIDEVDTIFDGSKNEELRGVLNSGYKTGAYVSRFTGKEVEDFPTFCPKMLVGIDNGAMPDTLRDRTIAIHMKRKHTDETVERFIERKIDPDADALRARIEAWATANYDRIMDAPEPEFIEGISDRKFEIAEPLLVLALIAGGKQYANKIRKEFGELLAGEAPKASLGMQALSLARELFEDGAVDRIPSSVLADRMGMSQKQVGNILNKYDVESTTIRFKGSKPAKGYYRKSFEDAWSRYL